MPRPIERRQFLSAAGAVAARGAVNACRTLPTSTATPHAPALQLTPMHMDRVTRLTVCIRSFRPLWPRLETEKIGKKTVVHNYGHGGSDKDVSLLPRRDGFVIQAVGDSDYHGDSIEAAVADRAEAEHGVTTVASLHQAEA